MKPWITIRRRNRFAPEERSAEFGALTPLGTPGSVCGVFTVSSHPELGVVLDVMLVDGDPWVVRADPKHVHVVTPDGRATTAAAVMEANKRLRDACRIALWTIAPTPDWVGTARELIAMNHGVVEIEYALGELFAGAEQASWNAGAAGTFTVTLHTP